MLIGSNSGSQTVSLHDDKRNAIGKTPSFVGSICVQIERFLQEPCINADDGHIGCLVALSDETSRGFPIGGAESVADLDEYCFGQPNLVSVTYLRKQ